MGPYLSIIIAARSDNYGGDQRRRLQLATVDLLEQLEEYQLCSEILLVDWNSPPNEPPLHDLIEWPESLDFCSVRSIVVPPKYHERNLYHERRPFAGCPAVNTGIRRARGVFIVSKASDTFFPDVLTATIARKELDNSCRYRVNRCDVSTDVLSENFKTRKERQAYCDANILTEYGYRPTKSAFPILHTDACGDFQLMHRDHWHTLRGFWERDVLSGHVDSLLSYAALTIGVKEALFLHTFSTPTEKQTRIMRIYKVRHAQQFATRRTNEGTETLSFEQCLKLSSDMLARKLSPIINDEFWGLGDVDLEIIKVRTASYEKDTNC